MSELPRPAPDDPLPLARQWLDEAERSVAKNPWAMALATVGAAGAPAVRYVLLKELSLAGGYIVFYTNYESRKAKELEATSAAAAVLYWPDPGRQLRLEGRIERSPAAESDGYFASRPRASQLNAWASEQSRPIASPELMDARIAALQAIFPDDAAIARPSSWGGYRLHIRAIEFWSEGQDRFHERLRFERQQGGDWSSAWLQP